MMNEYITLAFLLAQALAVYAAKAGAGVFYWIAATVVFLITPMLPLAISSIVSVILMRFVNVPKVDSHIKSWHSGSDLVSTTAASV